MKNIMKNNKSINVDYLGIGLIISSLIFAVILIYALGTAYDECKLSLSIAENPCEICQIKYAGNTTGYAIDYVLGEGVCVCDGKYVEPFVKIGEV